jgi:hypothetical protein
MNRDGCLVLLAMLVAVVSTIAFWVIVADRFYGLPYH